MAKIMNMAHGNLIDESAGEPASDRQDIQQAQASESRPVANLYRGIAFQAG
jgi:hypothetical protein